MPGARRWRRAAQARTRGMRLRAAGGEATLPMPPRHFTRCHGEQRGGVPRCAQSWRSARDIRCCQTLSGRYSCFSPPPVFVTRLPVARAAARHVHDAMPPLSLRFTVLFRRQHTVCLVCSRCYYTAPPSHDGCSLFLHAVTPRMVMTQNRSNASTAQPRCHVVDPKAASVDNYLFSFDSTFETPREMACLIL